MGTSFATRATRVLIAEESGSVRQLISDTLRNLGFLEITVVATGKDVFNALEYNDCDWIIMPTFIRHSVTAFHTLKAISETPRLRRVRMSLLVGEDDERYLPPAFHYGLLSWHTKTYVQDYISNEMNRLLEVMKTNNWTATLVAAEYFRDYMTNAQDFNALLEVEKHLLGRFPGSLSLLLRYGETQLRSGKVKEGLGTLNQACLIDERAKKIVDVLAEKHAGTSLNLSDSPMSSGQQNLLGIKSCVLVDPDTAVLGALKKLLSQAGVTHVETFDNGEDAWQWLSRNPEPDLLLQEWRIPKVTGPLLLQRIRHHGFINVPVNVVSSVIKPEESHLLREFGVANVIAKPFSPQSLFKSLVWTIQQHVYPTEQNSLQQKIKRLLQKGDLTAAERLKEAFLADARIKTSCKKTIEAHFAFCQGDYRGARDLGMEALRLQGDSLCLLNLIGKCLLKLGDNAAAMKIFEKAHSMSRMNIENLCLLAIAQYDNGHKEDAEASLRKAKELDGDNQMIGETECQIALLSGDATKAKDLMEELSSVQSVLAYMNNRAVSLTRSGRFEAGITLYQRTMEAIPPSLADAKDAVTYNLGLAYARYGELRQAADSLSGILDRKESKVHRKSLSLMKRVKGALAQNTSLPFYDTVTDDQENKQDDNADRGTRTAMADLTVEDLCLNGIYQLPLSEQSQWSFLFDNYPKFTDKSHKRMLTVEEGL